LTATALAGLPTWPITSRVISGVNGVRVGQGDGVGEGGAGVALADGRGVGLNDALGVVGVGRADTGNCRVGVGSSLARQATNAMLKTVRAIESLELML
jgi:hypothetical protein